MNPLDPRNPITQGKPSGLRITSSRDTVFIRWNKIDLKDIIEIQILRKKNPERAYAIHAVVEPESDRFVDTDVTFGNSYTYKIIAVGNNFESQFSDSISTEPGPTFSWVSGSSDNFNLQIYKLTHDSRQKIDSTYGFYSVRDIEPNPQTGNAWVIDFINTVRSQIIKLSPNGDEIPPVIESAGAADVALSTMSDAIWVADSKDSSVTKYSDSGTKMFSERTFVKPISVGVDQRSGKCWVADAGANNVLSISEDGQHKLVSSVTFTHLKWLSVDSNDGAVWVATESELTKIDENGEYILSVNERFVSIEKIAVNQNTGDVWVIDWNLATLSKLDKNGVFKFDVNGFNEPGGLAINEFDNSCLIADTGNDRLVKISEDGQNVLVVMRLIFPEAVAVQNESN